MHGDAADVGEGDLRLAQGVIDDGEEPLEMGASGDLRDDAAESRVQVGLRGDDAREDARLISEDGGGGLVAGRFDGEEVGHRWSSR